MVSQNLVQAATPLSSAVQPAMGSLQPAISPTMSLVAPQSSGLIQLSELDHQLQEQLKHEQRQQQLKQQEQQEQLRQEQLRLVQEEQLKQQEQLKQGQLKQEQGEQQEHLKQQEPPEGQEVFQASVAAQQEPLHPAQSQEQPQGALEQDLLDQPVVVRLQQSREIVPQQATPPSSVPLSELPPLSISAPPVESDQPFIPLVEVRPAAEEAELQSLVTRFQQIESAAPASDEAEVKAPASEVSAAERFATELDHLDQLGFTDRQFNLMLLNYNKGKLLPVITFLSSA